MTAAAAPNRASASDSADCPRRAQLAQELARRDTGKGSKLHVDVAQAVARLLDAPSPSHRVYNMVDDESPDLATLFASVGEPPPDGSTPERAKAFEAVMDGRRIREDLGFSPEVPRLSDATPRST